MQPAGISGYRGEKTFMSRCKNITVLGTYMSRVRDDIEVESEVVLLPDSHVVPNNLNS